MNQPLNATPQVVARPTEIFSPSQVAALVTALDKALGVVPAFGAAPRMLDAEDECFLAALIGRLHRNDDLCALPDPQALRSRTVANIRRWRSV